MPAATFDNEHLATVNDKLIQFNEYVPPTNVIPASSWSQVGSAIWSPYMTYYKHSSEVYNTYYYSEGESFEVANAFPGWHLPTSADFQYLLDYTAPSGAYKLKTTTGWMRNGNDQYGFGWKRLGFYQKPYDEADFFATNCAIWGATTSSDSGGHSTRVCLSIIDNTSYTEPVYQNLVKWNLYIPVRLVKDA